MADAPKPPEGNWIKWNYSRAPQGEYWRNLGMDAWVTEVRKYITETTKLGEEGLAQLIDRSTPVVNQVLNGKYNVKGETIDLIKLSITAAIDQHRVWSTMAVPNDYVRTRQSAVVEKAIVAALDTRESGIVTADSGTGKSITAQHVVRQRFGIVYVGCDVNDSRQTAFIDRLAEAIGLKHERAESCWRVQRAIQERLAGNKRTIVIDDAHYLVNVQRPSRSPALRIVKDLIEKAETPFVLLAEIDLKDAIGLDDYLGIGGRGAWYTQLKSRIPVRQRVTRQSIQAADVAAVLDALGVRCAQNILAHLTSLAQRPGAFRNVRDVARIALRAKEKSISDGTLRIYLKKTSQPMPEFRAAGRVGGEAEGGERRVEGQKEPALASA